MHAATDSIAAIASPPGPSARGLLRLSGPNAKQIADQLAFGLADQLPRQLTPTRLSHPDLPQLPAMALWMPGPGSYTGEATVELQLPGSLGLLQRVLSTAVQLGVRHAEPGEFSYRAFTHGKLGLSEAEGVAQVIGARSDEELLAAQRLLQGGLAHELRQIMDETLTLLALTEAGIDFTDQEDVVPIEPAVLQQRLTGLVDQLAKLIRSAAPWPESDRLPRVVLWGEASAGKSSLFNALLGRPRAVVDAQAGTTRDVLREPATLHGPQGRSHRVMLVDLAGLGVDATPIDRAAAQAAQQEAALADVILAVAAPGQAFHRPDEALAPSMSLLQVRSHTNNATANEPGVLPVDSPSRCGLNELSQAVIQTLSKRTSQGTGVMLSPRHRQAVVRAQDGLSRTASLADEGSGTGLMDPELIAESLRGVLDELGGVLGEATPDDVIGRVFSAFCVGK